VTISEKQKILLLITHAAKIMLMWDLDAVVSLKRHRVCMVLYSYVTN